ncbi:MAG: hypothetical protein UW85_C0019G0003 [Parcubacteria group bacterium GW2011_GWA1_Parcubacteria_45_10]|nr:MAG: hypothetical protein UW85_C0019G0003 [Parcubacteria group bacterium GW2011_GWA1_Parcubacteria_45_10]KKT87553.1 MAG: hypothetical protein UW89_C0024G0005 [Parcubacteria group bacterium GW2011_GWB1_45_10]
MIKNPLRILLVSIGFILVFTGGVNTASAAGLYFSPSKGTFYKNENFSVSVFVSSEQAINAVQGVISFPTEYFEAISVKSNTNSIVDLWVRKPSFSNASPHGNVQFEGVVLNPGFVGSSGKVMEIVFRVKNEGLAGLDFSDSAILANDGLGTNVLTSNASANFSLLPPRFAPETPASENLKAVEERIKEVEQKVSLAAEERETGILRFWYILPEFIRIIILVLVGLAAILLSLILLGFIIVTAVWLWNYARQHRRQVEQKIEVLPGKIKRFFRKAERAAVSVEQELAGDLHYGVRQIKKEVSGARHSRSLKKTLLNYWHSVIKVIKRFGEDNLKEKPL